MAYEVFTGYSETDPNNRITVETNKITWAAFTMKETAYVYSDKGVNHFAGDFEHLLTLNVAAITGAESYFWMIANDILNWYAMYTNGKSNLTITTAGSGATYYLYLKEQDGAAHYDTGQSGLAVATSYYLKIKRVEAVGTYGTIYNYIYSDSARTTLLYTQTLALHTSKKDYRYIYGINSRNSGDAGAVTAYDENLDLQEAAGRPDFLSLLGVS